MLVQSFTARMPLLTATSAFGLGRRCWSSPQPCYLRWLHGLNWGGSHRISDPAPLVWDPLPPITDLVPHIWDPAPFCCDPPLCTVYIWSAVGNPTSAFGPLGSSFGPSSLSPTGIHHLLLSNLTTGWLLVFSPAVNVNCCHGEQNRVGVSGDGRQLWQSPHGTAETVRWMIWFEFQFESRFVFMSEFRKHWVALITVATFARKYFKVICVFLDHLNTAFVFFTHHFQGESVLARYHHCFTPLLLFQNKTFTQSLVWYQT